MSTDKLQTVGRESKTLTCILFTELNIHLLLERAFLNFPGYSLLFTQKQASATEQLHDFRSRSSFSRDAKRFHEKTYFLKLTSERKKAFAAELFIRKCQLTVYRLLNREAKL
ncbi:hypothetical protein T265_08443 [Opisthorchis viverrini]|uniref:Uncharacterized protein n=1 Tax=Opisthorchis viverrini TaxID=6198 RepID=A0A074Z9H3_OPIVI|nr:hypothetical protein T265_08443 [Opisthorchis viverrini]KER23758.1 hypothetical protein T265_08443 [Opisthorchis viverrini]